MAPKRIYTPAQRNIIAAYYKKQRLGQQQQAPLATEEPVTAGPSSHTGGASNVPTREEFLTDLVLQDFVNPYLTRKERRFEKRLNNFGKRFFEQHQQQQIPIHESTRLDESDSSSETLDSSRSESQSSIAMSSIAMSGTPMEVDTGLGDMSGQENSNGNGGGTGAAGSANQLLILGVGRPIPPVTENFPKIVGKTMHYVVCGFNPFQAGTDACNPENVKLIDAYIWPALDLNVDLLVNYLNPAEILHLEALIVDGYTVEVEHVSVSVRSKGTKTPIIKGDNAVTPQNGTLNIAGYCITGIERLIKQHPFRLTIASEKDGVIGKIDDCCMDSIAKRAEDMLTLKYGQRYQPSAVRNVLTDAIGADSVFRRPAFYLGELVTTTKANNDALSDDKCRFKDYNSRFFNVRYL